MKEPDQVTDKMDVAAVQAQEELNGNINNWTAMQITHWWKKWYMHTGHKRLGRILIQAAK